MRIVNVRTRALCPDDLAKQPFAISAADDHVPPDLLVHLTHSERFWAGTKN